MNAREGGFGLGVIAHAEHKMLFGIPIVGVDQQIKHPIRGGYACADLARNHQGGHISSISTADDLIQSVPTLPANPK